MSNLDLPCYVSDPLCTALSTVDKKDKFPAAFQQPFPISHTNIFLLFNSHKKFFYCSFIVILIVLPWTFSYLCWCAALKIQCPEVLCRTRGLLHTFHELCSSLSTLGRLLLFLQKIPVHCWPHFSAFQLVIPVWGQDFYFYWTASSFAEAVSDICCYNYEHGSCSPMCWLSSLLGISRYATVCCPVCQWAILGAGQTHMDYIFTASHS